jgi:hypothetical protein
VLLDHYFSAKLREARIKALKVDLDAEKTV